MDKGKKQFHLSNNAAEVYNQAFVPAFFHNWANRLIELSGSLKGKTILDVACGSGVVARLAAQKAGKSGKVVGSDLNAGMLAVAKSLPAVEGAPIEWCQANAVSLPFPDASFDVITCQQGLQFIPDKLAAVKEMYRVLRNEGRVIIAVWQAIENNPAQHAVVQALEHFNISEGATTLRSPFSLPDENEIRNLLSAAGFSKIEILKEKRNGHFSTIAEGVNAFIDATPVASYVGEDAPIRQDIVNFVEKKLAQYVTDEGFLFPMESHIAIAFK